MTIAFDMELFLAGGVGHMPRASAIFGKPRPSRPLLPIAGIEIVRGRGSRSILYGF